MTDKLYSMEYPEPDYMEAVETEIPVEEDQVSSDD